VKDDNLLALGVAVGGDCNRLYDSDSWLEGPAVGQRCRFLTSVFGEFDRRESNGTILTKPMRWETEDDMISMFRFSNKDNKEFT
ncbi:MAG: hypothetical protein WBJ19_09480, partial [Rhodoferax sp.]